MLIVWDGHGYLTAVFTFGTCLAMEIGIEEFMADERFFQDQIWPLPAALALAAIPTAIVGWALNRGGSARRLLDPETGETVVVPRIRHSFFFIPMEWWGLILLVIAGATAMYRIATAPP